jgi:hypothetical protein
MEMKRKIKVGKLVIFVVVLLVIVFSICFLFKKKSKKGVVPQIEVIDTIDNFDYQLSDNKTKYYNNLFGDLKNLLSNENYDEEEYAVLIGQLFLSDFYDLDSKVMKSDVGGTQFVYFDYRSDFELGAIDSVYKYVESNVYGDRKQLLPVVKSVEKESISQKSFDYGDETDYDAYYLNMSISYERDLNYPTNVLLVIIHNNDKLEVAKMEVN